GAKVILTGRNPERLKQAALELDAQSTAAFDANDPAALKRFFQTLQTTIDHVMTTAGGPHYMPLLEMDFEQARQAISEHTLLALEVARNVAGKVRPGGTLLFMSGTGGGPPPCWPRGPTAQPAWRSNLPRPESPSSPPVSSTRRCPRRSSATSSTLAGTSFAPSCRSGASSDRRTLPHSPFTS